MILKGLHRADTVAYFRTEVNNLLARFIESSNTFMCHVRLKRSGAWWYEATSNQMLALRCAMYNGTLDQVIVRYQQRRRAMSE